MRRLLTVGAVSIVSTLFVACSDDEPGSGGPGTGGSAGTAGTGGSAGLGGSAGSTGTGGSAGSGGSAGTGGSAGSGGSAGDPDAGADAGDASLAPCTGCLEVRVSVTDQNQLAPFNIDLGATNLVDFSAGSLTFHIRAEAFGDSVGVVPFVNDATAFSFQGGAFTGLNVGNGFGTGDFANVTFDLTGVAVPPNSTDAGADAGPPDPATFDKREVRVIGIQVGTGGGYTGGAADIVVFIDSITFAGINGEVADFEFTNDAQGFVLNPFFGNQLAEVIHH